MDHHHENNLYDCLIAWVKTFNLDLKCDQPADFTDGVIVAQCLKQIDCDFFTDEWCSKIKWDTKGNWRLSLINLKKILQTLTDYYSEELNHSLCVNDMPNLNLLIELLKEEDSTPENSPQSTPPLSPVQQQSKDQHQQIDQRVYDELTRLLQLVLGCAVKCPSKSDFIQKIMEMNESTQHMIMTAIQELMSRDTSDSISSSMQKSSSSLSVSLSNGFASLNNTSSLLMHSNEEEINSRLKKSMMELNRLGEQKDEVDQKCKRLDLQVSELQDEKFALLNEIDMLKANLQREDQNRVDPNARLNKHLQQQLESTQEELYRLESDKEKFRIQFEAAKSEQELLFEKNIDLKKIAFEHQSIKDEMDILRHKSDKVEQLESQIESYKIKLEDMADQKRQLKSLEQTNTEYLEKIFSLEEEQKRMQSLRSQIDMYKANIQELHEQLLKDEMRTKKLEYEFKSVEEESLMLKSENSRVKSNYERLKEEHEEFQMQAQVNAQLKNQNEDGNDESARNQSMGGLFSSVELVNIPTETKEKLIRLFHENKLLKEKQNDLIDERFLTMQSQYDDEKVRTADLQAKLNETSKNKIELECELNELKGSPSKETTISGSDENLADEAIVNLKSKLSRSQSQYEVEFKNYEQTLKTLEEKMATQSLEIDELKESKEKEAHAKKREVDALEEKYKTYLEKAKIVIKSLAPPNPKNGTTQSVSEMQNLKSQNEEKDKVIKQLAKDNEKLRNSREQEESLIASAWYSLGANLNRRVTDDRIMSIGSSFLSQQRHLPNHHHNHHQQGQSNISNTSSTIVNNNNINNNSNINNNKSPSTPSKSTASGIVGKMTSLYKTKSPQPVNNSFKINPTSSN